jgi:hypothetical protein
MSDATPQIRTLRRAATVCGGIPALAVALEVSVSDLSHWLNGLVAPPDVVYKRALDLVARGRNTGAE